MTALGRRVRQAARAAVGWPDPEHPPHRELDFTVNFDRESGLAAYAAMSSRRDQWDSLLWQVPVLSFTAQAFLFTVALGQGQPWWGRVVAAGLSVNISVLSIMLMARHRQGELHAARWMENFEQSVIHLGDWGTTGEPFKLSRDDQRLHAGWIADQVPLRPMFGIWVLGLALFGLVGLGVIVGSLVSTY